MTAPAAPAPPRRRMPIVHPVLFAVLPVLALYTGNLNDVSLSDLAFSAAPVGAASLPIWWLCRRLTRDPYRGAVLASLFWVWFFAYGPWERWFAPRAEFAVVALAVYGALLLILVLLVSLRRNYAHLSGALQWIAAGLLLLQVFTIARCEYRASFHRPAPTSSVSVRTPVPPSERPHIVFIVLDGYARADVLADVYHYDNRPFLESLRRLGFQVAARGRANYCQTMLSLPSCLDLDYLDALAAQLGPAAGSRRPLDALLRANRTRAFLREQGYDFAALPTGFGPTQLPEASVHLTYRWAGLSDFQTALLQNTVLWPLLRSHLAAGLTADHSRAQRLLYALDHLPEAVRSRRPTFVFAHIMAPHPPFIFLRDGTLVDNLKHPGLHDGDRFSGTTAQYVTFYRDQTEFITHRTEAMLTNLLASARRPTAVVLLSDHGPGSSLRWNHPSEASLRERFGTLIAVRLPEGKTATLDDDISTVNTMRFVLSQCLGADLPPLPTRCYFSDYHHPYRFSLVADGAGRFRPAAARKGPAR